MPRALKLVAVCGVALFLSAPLVIAEEKGNVKGERVREIRERLTEQMKPFRGPAPLGDPWRGSEKAKTEMERHRAERQKLMKSAHELRGKIKQEVAAGSTFRDAVKKHLEDAKAIAKLIVAEWSVHFENLAKIVKEDGDAAVDRVAENLLKWMERPPSPQPDEQPQPRRIPTPPAENPNPENPVDE